MANEKSMLVPDKMRMREREREMYPSKNIGLYFSP
jgi:hypothetical protein